MCNGAMGGMSRPSSMGPFGTQQYGTRPMMSDERIPPSMPQKSGGSDSFGTPDAINAAPTPVNMAPQFPGGGPQGMPAQAQGPMNWAQRFSQLNLPQITGQMPNANPNAAFNRPEMSAPFAAGGQPPSMGATAMQQPMGPRMMDPRMMFQRGMPQGPQAPMNGAYDYSPLSAQQAEMNQQKAGLFPGAPPPPGYVAPPPGPFANYMNPILASMLGLGGQRPQGTNALNNATGQWGNIDWFPGIPKG